MRLSKKSGLFITALCWLMTTAVCVRAEVDQGRALAAVEACRELVKAVGDAASQSETPQLADPQTSALFGLALDASVADGEASRAEELALLFDMQIEAGRLVRAYLLKGIEAKSLSSDLSGELVARNFVTFLPEMAALYDFRVKIGSLISQSASRLSSVQPDPLVSSALATISSEQERLLLSAIAVASDQQIDAPWRAARVEALQLSAGGFTALMGRKKAQDIADRALAAAIAEQDREVAGKLKDFALTLLR